MKLLARLGFGLKIVLRYDYHALIFRLMSVLTIEAKIIGSKYSWSVLSTGSERQDKDGFKPPVHKHD